MKRICVFCGASSGADPGYGRAAAGLGSVLAERELTLVYGGAGVGMMGRVARSVLENGGQVIGVMPKALAEKEVALKELKDLRIVDSMHTRKALMAELSDGFIALPGGLGTIEEFVEVLTWAQLGFHRKPCGLLNVKGYYDRLIDFLHHVAAEQFMGADDHGMMLVDDDPGRLLRQFDTYIPPNNDKAAWAIEMERRMSCAGLS